jgi:hypothetical protein
MRTLLALTPLILIATTLPAQTGFASMSGLTPQNSPATVTTLTSQPVKNCPVGIAAQHTPGGTVLQVSPSGPHGPLGYNINLSALDGRLIRQASVTLHGIVGPHILPAASKGDPTTDATETFTLTPGDTPKPAFQSVVYAKKLTGVSWIQVDAVTYAGGKEWHQTNGSVCRVTPNGFLPIKLSTR